MTTRLTYVDNELDGKVDVDLDSQVDNELHSEIDIEVQQQHKQIEWKRNG